MDQELATVLATGVPFALMHADLDFFKDVNDTLGHAAGDHVLQEVAKIMVDETRATDQRSVKRLLQASHAPGSLLRYHLHRLAIYGRLQLHLEPFSALARVGFAQVNGCPCPE